MGLLKRTKPADAIAEEPLEEEIAAIPAEDLLDPDDDGIDDSATLSVLTAIPSPDEEGAPPPGDTDVLLTMFTEVGLEVADRSVLLSLAPEVEMDDLVTELSLVAAALGILQGQRQSAEPVEAEFESLAA